MMAQKWGRSAGMAGAFLAATLVMSAPVGALADHQWSSYHWNRDGVDPLVLTIGDNHQGGAVGWSGYLSTAIDDWNVFGGAHFRVAEGTPGNSDIESFNDDYGDSGWLGIASISATRGKNKHIVAGSSKVNEFYITLAGYTGFDQPVEWQHVLCQEIGHTYGLDHNRNGETGGTPDDSCMNDEQRPLVYPTPNIHDTEQLDLMYAEDHGADGGGGGGGGGPKCHPVFGCPAIGHVAWAEHFADETEMFDAADAVVNATVLSSSVNRRVGRAESAVPITRIMMRVTEATKGDVRGVIALEQTRGPDLEIRDDPGYVAGDNYTLYLRKTGRNTYRTVNPQGRIKR